jgi:hypothetical protein
MSTKFSMSRDINGYNGFGILPTYDIYNGLLAAGVAQTVTVPSTYSNWIAIFTFTPGASVWVSINGTAAAPAGAFASGVSTLNPAGRQVKEGDVISFITSDTTSPTVCVEFQAIAPYQN